MSVVSIKALPKDPLDALRAIVWCESELDQLRCDRVKLAREQGATWEQVAEAHGMSRQSAWGYYTARFRIKLDHRMKKNIDLSDDAALLLAVDETKAVRRQQSTRRIRIAKVFVENIVTMLDLVPDPAEVDHLLRDETDGYLVAPERENKVEYIITGDCDLLDWSPQLLPVVSLGKEVEFEESFGAAKLIISAMSGFRSLRLSRCIEQPRSISRGSSFRKLCECFYRKT